MWDSRGESSWPQVLERVRITEVLIWSHHDTVTVTAAQQLCSFCRPRRPKETQDGLRGLLFIYDTHLYNFILYINVWFVLFQMRFPILRSTEIAFAYI